ncbi:MAG: Clp protease N-terminal domain-containing protein [Evtepia gabavorous]
MAEAQRLSHDQVGSRHLLLGLLRQGTGGGIKLLVQAGLHPNQLYRQTALSLGGSGSYYPRARGEADYAPPASSPPPGCWTSTPGTWSRPPAAAAMTRHRPGGGDSPGHPNPHPPGKNNPVLLGSPGWAKPPWPRVWPRKWRWGRSPTPSARNGCWPWTCPPSSPEPSTGGI